MTARDVIAQALALSEAATDGWEVGHGWAYETDGTRLINVFKAERWAELERRQEDEARAQRNIEFAAAARTLLPAFAKALGDVLAVLPEPSDENPYEYDPLDDPEVDPSNLGDVVAAAIERGADHGRRSLATEVRTAITAALSEVTK